MTQTQADVRHCGSAAVAVRRRRLLKRSALAHLVGPRSVAVGRTDTDRRGGGGFFRICCKACLISSRSERIHSIILLAKGRRRELELKWSVGGKLTAAAVNDSLPPLFHIRAILGT